MICQLSDHVQTWAFALSKVGDGFEQSSDIIGLTLKDYFDCSLDTVFKDKRNSEKLNSWGTVSKSGAWYIVWMHLEVRQKIFPGFGVGEAEQKRQV